MAKLKLVRFSLGCGATKEKNEKLKVRNMYVCGMSIYFTKGRQKTSRCGST